MVIQCPQCGGHLLESRLASINAYGVMTWSDGYCSNWALNSVSDLAHCPWCHGVFWYADAKQLGLLPRKPWPMNRFTRLYAKLTGDKQGRLAAQAEWCAMPSEWKDAQHSISPTFPDLLVALKDAAHLTPVREAIVRRTIWWRSSDHLRCRRDGSTPLKDAPVLSDAAAKGNLLALLQLHESAIVEIPVEKAEILRQLGRFDEAINLLQPISSDDEKPNIASKIMQFARNKDTSVMEVWRSQYDY